MKTFFITLFLSLLLTLSNGSFITTKDNKFYINNTQILFKGVNVVYKEFPYYPNISFGSGAELKVDPHGNIWAHSPTHGVHVLLENTTYWPDINGFRRSNSPLLSDQINDIDFDEKKSLAYVATKNGLNIIRVPFGTPKKNYSNLKVSPALLSNLFINFLPIDAAGVYIPPARFSQSLTSNFAISLI